MTSTVVMNESMISAQQVVEGANIVGVQPHPLE